MSTSCTPPCGPKTVNVIVSAPCFRCVVLQPTFPIIVNQFTVAADTGEHAGPIVDLSSLVDGDYTVQLEFDSYGYAYDGWLRFPSGHEIHVVGGDAPGPYHHSYSFSMTVGVGDLPLFGESTGGDDMTFSNIIFTFTRV